MPDYGGQMPFLSVIMPAYNSARYISDAIESVKNQTFQNWELIVIDDGSSDGTAQIVKSFSSGDERIVLYESGERLGVSAARNKAVSLARGEWIAFLDSDDMWAPSKLEKQIALAEKKECRFVFTGSAFIDENGRFYKGIFKAPEAVGYERLKNHNVISCSSVFIKKELFESVGMEGDYMHEDYAAWLKILKNGEKAYGINQPLLIYRISSNSKSGNKLRSIKMTYRTFRFTGFSRISSVYFTCRHTAGAAEKYCGIKKPYKRRMMYET